MRPNIIPSTGGLCCRDRIMWLIRMPKLAKVMMPAISSTSSSRLRPDGNIPSPGIRALAAAARRLTAAQISIQISARFCSRPILIASLSWARPEGAHFPSANSCRRGPAHPGGAAVPKKS